MNFSEAFKTMGNQHLEEQKLISSGADSIKQFFANRKLEKETLSKASSTENVSNTPKAKPVIKVKKQEIKMNF